MKITCNVLRYGSIAERAQQGKDAGLWETGAGEAQGRPPDSFVPLILGGRMEALTLEEARTKHAQLGVLIEKLAQQAKAGPTLIGVPSATITLQRGEWYAGAVLNEDGSLRHHLVVSKVCAVLNFGDAQDWAAGLGLSCPTRQECRLIVAHRYSRLDEMSPQWFWTSEARNSSYAWFCTLSYGAVSYDYRDYEGGAVAVRRIVASAEPQEQPKEG
jgi:hypothetical protein